MKDRELRDYFADRDRLVPLLREYYAIHTDVPTYTGRWFDILGRGGDDVEQHHRITADDVLALQALSMRIPPSMSRELVSGDTGRKLNQLLQDVPIDVDLVDADEKLIGSGSAADNFWQTVRTVPGADWVTAGKLLARKRPRLVPVYDSVVRATLGWPGTEFWHPLREQLRADSRALWVQLQRLRDEAGLRRDLTPLRVFDVVLWMDAQRGGDTVGEPDEVLS